jgi:hypothetical protein
VESAASAAAPSVVTNGLASHPIADPSDSDQSDTTDVSVDGEAKAGEAATALVSMGNGKGAPDSTPLTATSS